MRTVVSYIPIPRRLLLITRAPNPKKNQTEFVIFTRDYTFECLSSKISSKIDAPFLRVRTRRTRKNRIFEFGLQTLAPARFRTVADLVLAESRAAVSYGFLEFFFAALGRTTKKPHATRRARGDTHSLFRTMAVKQMHAATPAARDAAACASLPLKCPSPVTLEAMHIARRCGVLTDLEVGSAGDGRNPSRRVSGALVGSVLRYDEEKENIDPVTGMHARLASGVAAGTNARGASRLSSNRAIATLSVFYRARSFSRFELTRDPPPPNARRRLGSSIVPRHRAWGDRYAHAPAPGGHHALVRRHGASRALFPRVEDARKRTPPTRASNNVTFSRSALKTRFARASPPRVSPSRPFHPRPRRLIAIPSRLEQERLKPGRSVLRAGAQVRRSARRAEHARARPEFLRERRFRKTRAISCVRHSCRRSKRASPPVADARSRLRTRRARSRASPNPNVPDPPNPSPPRVRRSPRTPARASGRARRRARPRIDAMTK